MSDYLTPRQIEQCDAMPADKVALIAQYSAVYFTLRAYAEIVEAVATCFPSSQDSDEAVCVFCGWAYGNHHPDDCAYIQAREVRGYE